MDQEFNPVDVGMSEASAQDDAAQAQAGEKLETIAEETQETAGEENPRSEPGWIKQRVSRAVEKAVAEAEARMAARYEAQLAELNAERVERQAQQLVRSGEFKSLETAKEYLTLKSGAAPAAQENTPAESGEQKQDPVIQAKAEVLAAQARKIQSARGIDVMAAYNENQDIQRRVLTGEWDFYDVAEYLSTRRNPPAPARSANGARAERTSIANMTDAQWKRLNENLANGRRYNARE